MADAEVSARLSIETDGEPQSIRDAAQAIGELGGSAGSAAPSLQQAEAAFESLNQSVEGGMAGASEKLAQARLRVDDYRTALEQARQAGQNVTAGQEQELARLESQYAAAARRIGEYSAAKRAAAKDIETARQATSNEIGSINSLHDVLEKGIPRWGRYVHAAGAVVATFEAAYTAGTQLREALNGLTGDGFDRAVQDMLQMERAADALVDGLDRVARSAETLASQRQLFEQLGLDGFTSDVERNAAALEAHARAVATDKAEVAGLRAEVDDLAKSVGVSREELDRQSASLAAALRAFAEQNDQLSNQDLGQIFGPMIQQLLDGYARLRTEVPPALAAVAQAWGVTTTAAEQAAARHRQIADDLYAHITGASRASREALDANARALEEALGRLNLFRLDEEQLTRAQAQVRQLVDAYTAAGERIPASLARVAAQLRIFQSEADLSAANARAAAAAADTLGSALERAGEKTVAASGDFESGSLSIEDVVPAALRAGISLDALMARYGAAGRGARESGTDFQAGAAAAAQTSQDFATAGASLEGVGNRAAAAGDQVAGAGRQMAEAAQGASELGNVDIDLTSAVSRVAELTTVAEKLEGTLARLVTVLGSIERAASAFEPIFQALHQVTTLAESAAAAVGRLVGAGGE